MIKTADTIFTEILVNSGATWGTSQVPNFGYMVSIRDYEYVTNVHDFGPNVIDAYEQCTPLQDGTYYGAWIDGDNAYLDLSIWTATEEEAHMIADLEDQKAIFNLYTNETEDLR